MTVMDFLTMLRARDVQVLADGDHLRCSAPPGALTPELQAALRKRKSEVLAFLQAAGSLAAQQRAIVPLQPRGTLPPVFGIGGHNGDVFCFRALARCLGAEQPFFGLQPPGLDGRREPLARLEDLAAYFAGEVRAFHPSEPCVVAGYCAGGTLAYELARQLVRQGTAVAGIALFGSPFPAWYRFRPQQRERFRRGLERLRRHTRALRALSAAGGCAYFAERLRSLWASRAGQSRARPDPVLIWRAKVGNATKAAIRRYNPGPFPGRLSFFWPSRQAPSAGESLARWRAVAPDFRTYFGPDGCEGSTMLRDPFAAAFAELFRQSAGEPPETVPVPDHPPRPAPLPRPGART